MCGEHLRFWSKRLTMGNCGSVDPDSKTNKEIENELKKDKEWLQDEIKLLLLGSKASYRSSCPDRS